MTVLEEDWSTLLLSYLGINRLSTSRLFWIVKIADIQAGRVEISRLREAAQAFDIPESVLSGHLKGKFPDVDGLHFERVSLGETA